MQTARFMHEYGIDQEALAEIAGWFFERPWLAIALVWWLKPVYDRVVLHVLSRAVFGELRPLALAVRDRVDPGRVLGNAYLSRVPAALHVGNGFGKFVGVSQLAERHVLVVSDLAGQAEHPLADDVALDLIGSSADGDQVAGQADLVDPAALRMLAAMLEVITELERMGDYAKGIAKVTQRLGEPELPTQLTVKGELEDAYDAISQFALMVAYGDFGAPPQEEE